MYAPDCDNVVIKLLKKTTNANWGKEMSKRNDYFKDFGIITITFTD